MSDAAWMQAEIDITNNRVVKAGADSAERFVKVGTITKSRVE